MSVLKDQNGFLLSKENNLPGKISVELHTVLRMNPEEVRLKTDTFFKHIRCVKRQHVLVLKNATTWANRNTACTTGKATLTAESQ